MKRLRTWLLAVMFAHAIVAAQADLQLRPAENPACVFAGKARIIHVTFSNSSDQNFDADIRARIFQTTSATAAQTDDVSWKTLHVLPQQTIFESTALDFPEVRAETKFIVQWIENSNQVIGTTAVWVYPTNLLVELKSLLGEEILGVLNPDNEIAPTLKQNGVKFVDLSQTTLENFSGRLAILGPFQAKAQMPDDLPRQIKALAKRNVAVIWLLPPPDRQGNLLPSFYTIMEGTNAIVVAQADMVSKLAENPQSQLHLIHFCKLALKPTPLSLPTLTSQP